METVALWREIATVVAIFAGVLVGALSVGSSARAWIKSQAFGLGGSVLTMAGVLLIGLSLYKTVEFNVGDTSLKAEMQVATQKNKEIIQPPPEDAPVVPLTPAESAAIQIKQEAVTVGNIDSTVPGRTFVQLTYSVVIDDPPAETSSDEILKKIDKVVYKLSKSWFDPNEIATSDRENNFSYSVRVWGPTNVEVDIYSVGKKEPVATRRGLMNLQGTIRLKS